MSGALELRIGGREFAVNRPGKVLFPAGAKGAESAGAGHAGARGAGAGNAGGASGAESDAASGGSGGADGDSGDAITKADLVAYYRAVAPRMLPHLRGRPLMLARHPDGLDGERLVQQSIPRYFPEWVHRAKVTRRGGGTVTHVVCDDEATLAYLAGQAVVTPHRWLSRADRPEHPDLLLFDLDPPDDAGFEAARDAARLLHDLLDGELGLPCAVMTTGSRGLHVVLRLDRRADWDAVRAFAVDTAALLAARHPGSLTTEPRVHDRAGRLYLDVGRDAYGQTAVAPYAVRALPGAPVATPLDWAELDDPALNAHRWTLRSVGERLASDPWAETLRRSRALGPARRRLDALRSS
jgi:bifunctional non-homologous end joining protein LigD